MLCLAWLDALGAAVLASAAMNAGTRKGGLFYRRIRRLIEISLLCTLLGACAAAPIQEMSDARQAIKATRVAMATSSEPSPALEQAETLMVKAQRDLRLGDYRAARNSAIEARELAAEARKQIALRQQ